jgi:hypothetical protein
MAKTTDFALLEKKLNIATNLVDELEIEECDIFLPSSASEYPVQTLVEKLPTNNEVFSIDTLKTDFIMIRQNVMKLIATGQRVCDSASLVDVSDMKPSTLQAIAILHQTLGSNIKLMVDIYKQIADIEKTRDKTRPKDEQPNVVTNSGTIVNNNIAFQGDISELLEIINQNQLT